ncbi:protein yellow [Copidosoma floridanum]|uniref:protein yellow n=1 Tax=Copidosoma floridanum TaxID=29053 RepID=UPI0006C98FF7|nr:protein yellow [Copidosoma floridanum]
MLLKYGVALTTLCALSLALKKRVDVPFEWRDGINYTWPSYEAYQRAVENNLYVKGNNRLINARFWKENIYLTIPRVNMGVPVTLAVTQVSPMNRTTKAPLLEPYPNWEMQKEDANCSGLQLVWAIEIDPTGRLWVLDSGRFDWTTKKVRCPARLVILDLEAGGKVVTSHVFPTNVADPGNILLSQIVLDHENGGLAYISGVDNTGVIVFSLQNLTSWRLDFGSSIYCLLLSPADTEGADRVLYYTTIYPSKVFQVPTRVLLDKSLTSKMRQLESEELGFTPLLDRMVGMTMSNKGTMFLVSRSDDGDGILLHKWESSKSQYFDTTAKTFGWPKIHVTFPTRTPAFDENGDLWIIDNFRSNNRGITFLKIGMKNYQYYKNGTVPKLWNRNHPGSF